MNISSVELQREYNMIPRFACSIVYQGILLLWCTAVVTEGFVLRVKHSTPLYLRRGRLVYLYLFHKNQNTPRAVRLVLASTKLEKSDIDIDNNNNNTDKKVEQLKQELLSLGETTRRGFQASAVQRKRAKELCLQLAKYNPTKDPAYPYYEDSSSTLSTTRRDAQMRPSLVGKWNLVYTDAPDITSLDTQGNPLALASLGRIGQNCAPPEIQNVIEWNPPLWMPQNSRVLQKVVTQASVDPSIINNDNKIVQLKLVGLELTADSGGKSDGYSSTNNRNPLVDWLANNPLVLRGPWTAPFGQFELLYLDAALRIILTRGYIAVNVRCDPRDEWF